MEAIKKISADSENYPDFLKQIKNPPKALYFQGDISIIKKFPCFAIVGTRRNTLYGKQLALDIAGDLAEAGFIIISGLAPGIDTFAHQGALERNGKTIAVLGSGLDRKSIYPKENIKLAEKIVDNGGLLLSEYPANTSASRFTFPQRNRIVAGISKGVLVIEAKEKSGSLITANYAFKQKKKLFAIPGAVNQQGSRGPHLLIKQGKAKLVESAQDILKEFDSLELKDIKIKNQRFNTEKNIEENIILNALKNQSLHIDKIIEQTKISAQKVASTLAILELKGKVRNLGGNFYSLKN